MHEIRKQTKGEYVYDVVPVVSMSCVRACALSCKFDWLCACACDMLCVVVRVVCILKYNIGAKEESREGKG